MSSVRDPFRRAFNHDGLADSTKSAVVRLFVAEDGESPPMVERINRVGWTGEPFDMIAQTRR
jgi:hypothetical protein